MSAGTAIGMVSESLRELLAGEMTLTPPVNVTLLSPDDTGGDRRVNLFLYKVGENPFFKNADWQVRPGDSRLAPPPLALNLSYLLTAYAPNDPLIGNATSHAMLGEAMRVFHEHPVLPAEYLETGLADAREEIRIVPTTLDVEAISQIWATFTQPYRASAPYDVSVVQLDAAAVRRREVPDRVRTVGVPGVQAPFHPPVVTAMTPSNGPAGTTVTFAGQGLNGWQASVRVTGAVVLDGAELTGESFNATLPASLDAGLHEVRVSVSSLFRRVFLFEVP